VWADGVGQWYSSKVGQSPVVLEEGRLKRWKLKPSENCVRGHQFILRQILLSNANRSDLVFWNNIDEMCEHGQALQTRLKPIHLCPFILILFNILCYGTSWIFIIDFYCKYNSSPMDCINTWEELDKNMTSMQRKTHSPVKLLMSPPPPVYWLFGISASVSISAVVGDEVG
jgi:hypothetical protein